MENEDSTRKERGARGLTRRELMAGAGVVGAGALLGVPGRTATEETGLPNRVDDLEPPDREDFRRRLDRVRNLMAEGEVDALFVEAGASLSYFTGVRWGRSERLFGVVVPRKGEIAYVAPAFEEGRARENLVVGSDLRVWQENESPYLVLREIAEDRGFSGGRIAVEPSTRYFVAKGIGEALPAASTVDGSSVVNGCRGRKDAKEIGLMRRANAVTQAAIARAVETCSPGMSQGELAAAVREAHVEQGAPPGWALVLFGPNAAFPHGTDASYRLGEGDVVLMDCGTSVHGYQSDITRTFVFGSEPSPRQKRIWDTVRTAQAEAYRAAEPGVPCGELDRIARKRVEDAGFGSGYELFTHRLGHGIGLEGHEWPYLVQDNDLPLAPGMTFSDEPGIYVVGELGVRIEDIIHVTSDGCEYLSEPVDELEVIGA